MAAERQKILNTIQAACQAGARKVMACEMIGLSVRTIQRWESMATLYDGRLTSGDTAPNKLALQERQAILSLVNQPSYAGLPPSKIVPLLASEGRYLASESTFYRVLKSEGLLAHRHKNRPAQSRSQPRALVASQANQVYSWDITYCGAVAI